MDLLETTLDGLLPPVTQIILIIGDSGKDAEQPNLTKSSISVNLNLFERHRLPGRCDNNE